MNKNILLDITKIQAFFYWKQKETFPAWQVKLIDWAIDTVQQIKYSDTETD
jgi:hypothetical protein